MRCTKYEHGTCSDAIQYKIGSNLTLTPQPATHRHIYIKSEYQFVLCERKI